MKKRIVFLGSKPIGYDCFQYLIQKKEELKIDIIGLGTQERKEFDLQKDLKQLAIENGIPVIEKLEELPECDIIYSVQYHLILKSNHIAKANELAVNLHLAPLPEYRGCNQFSFAILEEAKEFGVTIHQMNAKIDNGDILFQNRFLIPENIWVNELYDLTVSKGYELFKNTLSDLVQGQFTPIPQDDLIEKYGSSLHFRNEINEIKEIDLNSPKGEIERRIRATYMPGFEPPYFYMNGKKMYFSKEEYKRS